ncbi:hypothetical protein AYO20_02646 [Fonsecaea nubica]|uniref:DUF7924 domain-containing protein n=1 Tax=Fonsecaea nubica TaxID=856822 RepID=A0A178DA56_9EURO|nr:hypothetical protein AYO20_02646 [Fonsecaea nubica]OAL38194.1 hypothetical protein AYO20_02646 [Fonsecaea nubica]
MSVSLTKTSRKNARLQEKQAASQQGTARRGRTRSLQKPVVKQYNRRNKKDKTLVDTELELDLSAKRPRYRRAQLTETRTGLDKENLVESWLEKLNWSRRSSTENEAQISETSFKMPRKPPAVLPSPDNSFEGSISTSRKPEKSAASVHDADYRQSLRDRNIYINREDPRPELKRRAGRIISRSRTSPEMDDEVVQQLIRTSRRVEEEGEEAIVLQLAPDLIPAMKLLPDTRLASNADQPWYNSVPVPLDTSILSNPLPLPKPKPDLAFGYSEAAFTRNQLGTIGLLVDDQFGRSYAVPDQKVRFPFLEIEFKSQAQNGTHYVATNQAAGAGSVALNGYIDLIQRSFGMDEFDYEEPRYFSRRLKKEDNIVFMLKDFHSIFYGTQTVFERFLEQSRTFSTMVLMHDYEHFAGHWMYTARQSSATETRQMRRRNGNLKIDRNLTLDNKAEEEFLGLKFKRDQYKRDNEAEEAHMCLTCKREKMFPEKKSELAGSYLDRSNLCTLSKDHNACRPRRAVKFQKRSKFPLKRHADRLSGIPGLWSPDERSYLSVG